MDKFQHLTINEVADKIGDQHYQIVDIRDFQSFNLGHIPGAIHLTNESIADFMRSADLDKAIVVCCYHGISSQQAAQYLISQDFTEVYSLDGGYTAWQAQYPEHVESV